MTVARAPSPRLAVVALATLPLIAAGCSQTDSKDVRTSGITAAITASVDDDVLYVSVRLTVGTLNTVDLEGDDRLVATVGGERRNLSHDESFDQDAYSVRFTTAPRPGTRVTVALQRGSADASAPVSSVLLPGPIGVTRPADGSRHRRSADLVVSPTAAAGRPSVAWQGRCVTSGSSEQVERGSLLVPAGSITDRIPAPSSVSAASSSPPVASRSCVVTLTVSRTTTGTLDDHFKGGSIRAVRTASVMIASLP